jgi:hypothetical protein
VNPLRLIRTSTFQLAWWYGSSGPRRRSAYCAGPPSAIWNSNPVWQSRQRSPACRAVRAARPGGAAVAVDARAAISPGADAVPVADPHSGGGTWPIPPLAAARTAGTTSRESTRTSASSDAGPDGRPARWRVSLRRRTEPAESIRAHRQPPSGPWRTRAALIGGVLMSPAWPDTRSTARAGRS